MKIIFDMKRVLKTCQFIYLIDMFLILRPSFMFSGLSFIIEKRYKPVSFFRCIIAKPTALDEAV